MAAENGDLEKLKELLDAKIKLDLVADINFKGLD